MLVEYNLRSFLLPPLFFVQCPLSCCSTSHAVCAPSAQFKHGTWRNNLSLPVHGCTKTRQDSAQRYVMLLKKIVTAAERGLGELINVTFIYIYEQNLINSTTVFIPFLIQQPIHTVARVSLRLHRYSGLHLLENVERSLYSVLSRSQQMTWDNLICARNIFHLHFAFRKSKSTVNNILSTHIYSAQFHGVLPLTQIGTRSVLNH